MYGGQTDCNNILLSSTYTSVSRKEIKRNAIEKCKTTHSNVHLGLSIIQTNITLNIGFSAKTWFASRKVADEISYIKRALMFTALMQYL